MRCRATFPKGEAFFVESVRTFRDGAPPKLADEIKAFITQEVMHSREHVQFNKRALEAGYDLSGLEARVEWRLSITKSRPPIVNLAATMALEHFTAILAHQLLAQSAPPRPAPTRRMPRCGAGTRSRRSSTRASPTTPGCTRRADWPRWKRWKVKAKVMLFVTRNFVVDRSLGTLELLRQDGITGPKAWARMLWFAWVRPGMLRKILGAWLAFFLPGFHPWNHDDRALIARTESDYADALMPDTSPA